MSGIAIAGNCEVSVGLMPRRLRVAESIVPAWAPDEAPAPTPTFEPETIMAMREPGTLSITDQMRQRIATVGKPAPRRTRPLLFGLTAVAVIAAAIVLFPDTVLAFLPAVDAAP
jgi:hypothetical protein